MKARLLVTLLAVFGLTAFAPAPLPRPQRRGDSNHISVGFHQVDHMCDAFRLQDHVIIQKKQKLTSGDLYCGLALANGIRRRNNFSSRI